MMTNYSYANSMLQVLFFTPAFRSLVMQFPNALPEDLEIPEVKINMHAEKPPTTPTSPSVARVKSQGSGAAPANAPNNNHPPPPPSVTLDYSLSKQYGMEESLYSSLRDLYRVIEEGVRHKGEDGELVGVLAPVRLIATLREKNELYRGTMHQDAHEFLNYLLNAIIEDIAMLSGAVSSKSQIHDLFEGVLVSETKCLTCENVTRRDEEFLDLSIDIEAHSSVTACLRQFSTSEMLCEKNKFHCDICCGLQEAERRMKIKRPPQLLALHLKRFKYAESMQRLYKLLHRVVYPPELRLFNTTDDADALDRLYELYAIVVHIGGGAYHGHYVAIVKDDATDPAKAASKGSWLLIDDDNVERVNNDYVYRFFGDGRGLANAYVLFYRMREERALQPSPPSPPMPPQADVVPVAAAAPLTLSKTLPGPTYAPEHSSPTKSPPDEDRHPQLSPTVSSPPIGRKEAPFADGGKKEEKFSVFGVARRAGSMSKSKHDDQQQKSVRRIGSTGGMRGFLTGKRKDQQPAIATVSEKDP